MKLLRSKYCCYVSVICIIVIVDQPSVRFFTLPAYFLQNIVSVVLDHPSNIRLAVVVFQVALRLPHSYGGPELHHWQNASGASIRTAN